MFRVKICGITSVDDALLVAAAGADAIGLNCYQASPRYCPPEVARAIVQAIPARLVKVGVFVNAAADEIRAAAAAIGLDVAQLHGDEPPELLRAVRPLPTVKVFRIADELPAVADYLRGCHRAGCVPRMVMVDASRAGQYGGTGATVDWRALATARREFGGTPLVLAGGLTPANVRRAIHEVRPWAVDVASGVESSPGKKSAELVRQFVAEAVQAFSHPVR